MLCVKPQMVSNRFENLHPNSEDEEDGEKGEGNDDLSHYCRYFCPFPPVQDWFILKLKKVLRLLLIICIILHTLNEMTNECDFQYQLHA